MNSETQENQISHFWMVNRINPTKAKVFIYGDIGYQVEASDFVTELSKLASECANIDVHINSNGGDIFQGFAILNAMRSCKAYIETYVDGVAASMGSVIMLGGRKVHMSKYATIMTHKASTVAIGSASNLRATADMIEGLEQTIAAIYAARTGLTPDEAKAKYLSDEDRWITAQQALSEKLIDSIYDADQKNSALPIGAQQSLRVAAHFQNGSSNTQALIQYLAQMKTDPAFDLSLDDLFLSPSGVENLKTRNPALYALKFKEKYGFLPTNLILSEEERSALNSDQTFAKKELSTLYKMSFEELWKGGKLERLRDLDQSAYNVKLAEHKLQRQDSAK